MQFVDNIPWPMLLIVCVLLGLSPFAPEPHIVEKFRMLIQGTLKKPLDIFDLFYHLSPFIIVIVKLIRMKTGNNQ